MSASALLPTGLPTLIELGAEPPVATAAVATIEAAPVDVYTRVARAAKGCWLGPNGPLSGKYAFLAEAQPESRGGNAEIVIYERGTVDGQKGVRAFSIVMGKREIGTKLEAANAKMPPTLGAQMLADAERWAKGDETCSIVDAGWAPDQTIAEPVGSKKAKAKSKAKAKAKTVKKS